MLESFTNLDEICKKLVLVYEFDEKKIVESNFENSYNLITDHKITSNSKDYTLEFQKKSIQNLKNFTSLINSKNLIRQRNGDLLFLPTQKRFSSVLDAYLELKNNYLENIILDKLKWQEFEILITQILDHMGYHVHHTFRFKRDNHRYEIDVIGRKSNMILLIDAKRWSSRTINKSALKKAVQKQENRAYNLMKSKDSKIRLQSLLGLRYTLDSKKSFEIIPVLIVSNQINDNESLLSKNIFSIRQFNDFLINLHKYKEKIMIFHSDF